MHQENSFDYDGIVSGQTIYAYVGGNPISNIDPLGLTTMAPGDEGNGLFLPGTEVPLPPRVNTESGSSDLECVARCTVDQYMICAPWGVAGMGVGKPLGGAAASAVFGPEMYVPGSVIGGVAGGFLGTQACKLVLKNEGCYERCVAAKKKNQCEKK